MAATLGDTMGLIPYIGIYIVSLGFLIGPSVSVIPIVVNTWGWPSFRNATAAAWDNLLTDSPTAYLDAVEKGCAVCETLQCDYSVGYGGSPDETGQTTLDAMIMDGATMRAGAVTNVHNILWPTRLARLVMDHTLHTTLSGAEATAFAAAMGLTTSDLSTTYSTGQFNAWVERGCQPNFRVNSLPDPAGSCGPYEPVNIQQRSPGATAAAVSEGRRRLMADRSNYRVPFNHDTISMVAIDANGNIAAAASSNGRIHKVPGRVGDAGQPGGAAYADNDVGGCGATGDGDLHLRFLPCYQVVESMRQGMTPQAAAEDAVRRILRHEPNYQGGIVAVDKAGNTGGAGHGWAFNYAVRSSATGGVRRIDAPSVDLNGYLPTPVDSPPVSLNGLGPGPSV